MAHYNIGFGGWMLGKLRGLTSRILFYLFQQRLEINPDSFADKRIIIIGPARTVIDELEGISISNFDVVVRMNRAIDVPLVKGDAIWRLDVLFHNLKEAGERSAGAITNEKVIRSGTRYVVFPGGGRAKALVVVRGILKLYFRGVKVRVGMIPESIYAKAVTSVDGFSPTTGFIALLYLLECKFRLLHIVGFTFFQTKYMENYNDNLARDADGYSWAQQRNLHHPQLEASHIKRTLCEQLATGRKIVLGRYVESALSQAD